MVTLETTSMSSRVPLASTRGSFCSLFAIVFPHLRAQYHFTTYVSEVVDLVAVGVSIAVCTYVCRAINAPPPAHQNRQSGAFLKREDAYVRYVFWAVRKRKDLCRCIVQEDQQRPRTKLDHTVLLAPQTLEKPSFPPHSPKQRDMPQQNGKQDQR